MSTNGILKVEAGIDWITVTGDRLASWEKVRGMAETLWKDQVDRGHKAFQVSRHGFSLSCVSGVQYGQGNGGWMVVLGSEMAAKYWLPFAAYGSKVTRCDLQTTIWYAEDDPKRVQRLYDKAWLDAPKKARKAMTIIVNGRSGDTLYYGSRSSAQFGRVYDKYRQKKMSPAFQNALRYEVEYKKPLSGELVKWLLTETRTTEHMGAKVLNWFADRGISVPEICTIPSNAIQFPQEEKPIDKKLEWLRKTVRPVYRQLVALGYQVEADGSIGVSDGAITIEPIGKEV